MTQRRGVKSAVGRYFPRPFRDELYRLRVLGARDYSGNKWRHATGRAPAPSANAPFDIGGPVPIVLHESTVPGIRSHWVDSGQGLRELRAFRHLAPSYSTFLDIGAAEGIFSAAFCALTGRRAYAFEPSPAMYKDLAALIELNPGFDIVPCRTALGAVAGSQQVQFQGAQFRGVDIDEAPTESMVVEPLDAFVARNELTPDFVKIDVEGMELGVLRGGGETFSRSVDIIMLEIHSSMILGDESISDIQPLLDSFGFKLFTLDFAPIPDLASHLTSGRQSILPATNIVCAKSPPSGG